MDSMASVSFALTWIVLHLGGYFFGLRLVPKLNHEKAVLGYHAGSFAILGCWLLYDGLATDGDQLWLSLVAVLCMHGIYSITFWEFWGGSDGGFSLRIMDQLGQSPQTQDELEALFRALGAGKLDSRLEDLRRARLICYRDERYEIRGLGRLIATVLAALHSICNYQRTG
jgi:hypothetical protein